MRNRVILYFIYICDKCIDIAVRLVFVYIVLYGCYGLYDHYMIYNYNGHYNKMIQYKEEIVEDSDCGLETLNLVNKDICGWLCIENTAIDYPILQSDDNQYYINRDYEGNYSLIGSVFLDYRNHNDFSHICSLLYAHSMDGNRMFGEIPHYLDTEYFNNHLSGYLYADNSKYSIDIFACVLDDAYNEVFYNPHEINNKEEFIQYIKNHSKQYRDIAFLDTDHILAMSTCSGLYTNARVLVFARIRNIY